MNKKEVSASAAGNISLGGEISVHRLGFGAMRLTGEGIWGPPKDRKGAIAHLRSAVEGSLKRLRLDRIEVYQLHTPDPVVSFEASMETLAQLRNEGKIRLIGLSNVTQEHIERARKIVPIVSVQNRYSFADREWDYVVDYCESNGIAFIPWFPLGAGKVAGDVLNQIAQAHRASPTQVALAWLLRRSPIMLPIPGTSSIAHLEQNVAAASLRLADEEYEKLSGVPELVGSR